ncbi:MAG: hypothetical protein ABL951_04045 [Alphaproteobacteria bacterium]
MAAKKITIAGDLTSDERKAVTADLQKVKLPVDSVTTHLTPHEKNTLVGKLTITKAAMTYAFEKRVASK